MIKCCIPVCQVSDSLAQGQSVIQNGTSVGVAVALPPPENAANSGAAVQLPPQRQRKLIGPAHLRRANYTLRGRIQYQPEAQARDAQPAASLALRVSVGSRQNVPFLTANGIARVSHHNVPLLVPSSGTLRSALLVPSSGTLLVNLPHGEKCGLVCKGANRRRRPNGAFRGFLPA